LFIYTLFICAFEPGVYNSLVSNSWPVPIIAQSEITPLISQLLDIVRGQAAELQKLKDEIARLKDLKAKPEVKPSGLDKNTKPKSSEDGKRPGSAKRPKTAGLEIHEEKVIQPEFIPENSVFKGYTEFVVQDLKIRSHNICYRLARYETADGSYVTGTLPLETQGHFGGNLRSFILYQYQQCHVTQPLLLEQLLEWGVDISSGKLNAILTEGHDTFHEEKREILKTGLDIASYIQVDDTGARHQGKNGVCTHIGNDLFAWFESTSSKSRTNFLTLLCAGDVAYFVNETTLEYIRKGYGLVKAAEALKRLCFEKEFNELEWQAQLDACGVKGVEARKAISEGALVGNLVHRGVNKELVILSDDAPQFAVFLHALCWVHAERHVHRLIANTEAERAVIQECRDQIWSLYRALLDYKACPSGEKSVQLEAEFDQIFKNPTSCSKALNQVLTRQYKNKQELLVVLKRPEIPLHNNGSETDIREYAKRRKVQGGTRSDDGRRSRDTFTSLKKTCRKLKVSFWAYLQDRISRAHQIPQLPELMRIKAGLRLAPAAG
jgi:hypothetical protein